MKIEVVLHCCLGCFFFSLFSPWPVSPESPITTKMLLFGNWTLRYMLGHQSVSFTLSHMERERKRERKKKEANCSFFFHSAHWGRKNIALRLTSNQIALGFHSLCPRSICTNHHRPTWISHPGWGILTSSPQYIPPSTTQHTLCAHADTHTLWSDKHDHAVTAQW